MGALADLGGAVGDIAGWLKGGGADDEAQTYYKALAAKYGKLDPRITAQQVGPSAVGASGADSAAAQRDALRELTTQYRTGGLDAISRGQLAEAENEGNRAATARGNAVQENARAQGVGRSGVTMALQQQAGQQAMGGARDAAHAAAATSEAGRRAAIAGAGSLATGMRDQDYTAGAAQDAVAKYNAGMRMAAQQGTFSNQMGQLGGEGAAYGGAWKAGQNADDRTRRGFAGLGRLAGTAGDWMTNPGGASAEDVPGMMDYT